MVSESTDKFILVFSTPPLKQVQVKMPLSMVEKGLSQGEHVNVKVFFPVNFIHSNQAIMEGKNTLAGFKLIYSPLVVFFFLSA